MAYNNCMSYCQHNANTQWVLFFRTKFVFARKMEKMGDAQENCRLSCSYSIENVISKRNEGFKLTEINKKMGLASSTITALPSVDFHGYILPLPIQILDFRSLLCQGQPPAKVASGKLYKLRATYPDLDDKIDFKGGGICYMTEYNQRKMGKGSRDGIGLHEKGGIQEEIVAEKNISWLGTMNTNQEHETALNNAARSNLGPQIDLGASHIEDRDSNHSNELGGRPRCFTTDKVADKGWSLINVWQASRWVKETIATRDGEYLDASGSIMTQQGDKQTWGRAN